MDDFLACSDLCEENQFFQQARVLRALAGAGGKLHVVAARADDYNDEHSYLRIHDDGQPQTAFTDRGEAERAADLLNANFLRGISLENYGNETKDFTSLPEAELNRRVSAILGERFTLWVEEPEDIGAYGVIPESATDEQMVEISRLFDKLQMYHVLDVEFGG